jgi:hypothetical protein
LLLLGLIDDGDKNVNFDIGFSDFSDSKFPVQYAPHNIHIIMGNFLLYDFGDVSSSFVVTTCQLEIAGVAFLVGKGKNRNWATSTFAGDVNPNFTTMSVSEMLIHFGLV